MNRKKDAMKRKIQAIPQKIQATLGTERKINGLIESLPSSICMKKVSLFTCIGEILPMTIVLFREMYDIFIARRVLAFSIKVNKTMCFQYNRQRFVANYNEYIE